MNEETLFTEALGKQGATRAAFLDEHCKNDVALRKRLEDLLRAHDHPDPFLNPGAPAAPDAQVATVDAPLRETVGAVIGPYKLIEPIGEGGMGTVWMAQQTEPVKRVVAVKLIKAGMDSRQVIARFEAERQALALMDHPNIARVLDGGTTGASRPYFVMDLVRGVPITKYCDEHHLTPRQRLELFIPVCQAVQHAHQKGIIHRDLKPSNVLVALYDGKPVPKVIDFGVAKAAGQPLTEQTLVTGFGAIVGTLEYMSPEQAEVNQLDIDTRSDIYSLGVLLYELLAGSPPFARKELEKAGMLEMLRVIREQEPSKPSTKLSTAEGLPTLAANRGTEPAKLTKLVRGELDWIVMKALEKDRNRRYETANGFAMDVQRYLADEQVMACPPSVGYRLRKFVRRNKGPVWAVAIVLLSLLAGIVSTTWVLIEARNAAVAEKQAKERAEANFALANEAVEKYLGTVTNHRKLHQADFHQLRKELLESAIPFFQKLTEQKSDDPEVEARRGRAHGRLANVRFAMGEHEAAVQDSEAERAIFARLSADFPTRPAYLDDLAVSLNNLGHTLRHVGRHREAQVAYRQAVGIRDGLVAEFPAEPKYNLALANTCNNLANLLDDLGQRVEAEILYRKAIALQEKLNDDFPTVREYREGLANTHSNLGALLGDLGNWRDAEAAIRRALEIRESLATDYPAQPEYRSGLASSHNSLGLLLEKLGKCAKAVAFHRQAIAIQKKLVADFPTVPEHRQELAGSYHNLGSALEALDDNEEAATAFREAIGIHQELAGAFPTVPTHGRDLAAGLNNLGLVLQKLGKRPEAEAAHRRALAVQEKLAAAFPSVPLHAVHLAGGYCNFGIWLRYGGQPETALEWFQKAIATLEPVLAKEPRLVDAREFLRNSHKGKAEAFEDLGQPAEAAHAWERALELDDGARKATIRVQIARNRKDAAGCLAAAAEYEARKPTDAGGLFDAGCYRAVCATVLRDDPTTPAADVPRLANEQADLAMAWLHKAVAAGYKDAEHVKHDKDLDALRERADFKKLLAEVEAKQKQP